MKKKGVMMMLIATLFWGDMGISSRFLNDIHLGWAEIAFIRCFFAAFLTTIFLYFTDRSAFKVGIKGLIFCIFYGVLNFCIGIGFYSIAVSRIPISVATVLMFSNPIWVTLFNFVFFKEMISLKKLFVISLCVFGCVCIIDIFSTGGMNLDKIGILTAVLNGMTFALQIVMPRFVEGKVSKSSILLYGFWASTILLVLIADIGDIGNSILHSQRPAFYLLQAVSIGALSTFIANTLYVKSTTYIGTTAPSMMVALEPIFASILAFFIFSEAMKPIQIFGAFLVIVSIFMLEMNISIRKTSKKIIKSIVRAR